MKTRDAGIRATLVMGLVASSLVIAPAAFAQKKPKKPVSAAAAATPPDDKPIDKAQLAEAKKRYTSGNVKFKAGDFDGALQDFQAADAIKSTPQTAKFIGSCLDSLGRFPEAVAAYQRFLASASPAKMGPAIEEIKARVSTIQLLPGTLHVTSDPSSTGFSIDGKPQPSPTPTEVEASPGHHTIHFEAPDHDPVDKEIDVTFASRQNVDVTLPSNLPPPPPPVPVVAEAPAAAPPSPTAPVVVAGPPPESHQGNTAAWITGGAAVVAVGIGTAFGVMALNDKNDFNNTPTTATADSGENHALVADMAFGVAVTLGVTSLVLFLSKDDAPPAAATSEVVTRKAHAANTTKRSTFTITPSPIVTPHGAGAGALIQF